MTPLEAALRALIVDVVRAELPTAIAAALREHASPGPTAEYIDDRALAEWLAVSRETIQQWRTRGEGPPYIKVARRAVRYAVADVRAWMNARRAVPARR